MKLLGTSKLPRLFAGAILLLIMAALTSTAALAQGPTYGQGPYGSNPYGSGSNPYGSGSYGSNPYGSGSYGSGSYGGSTYGARMYIVQFGDTLFSIARRFGVSESALISANHIANPNVIFAGMRLVIPGATQPPASNVYIVRPGDTLTSIAIRFHTSVIALSVANRLPNPNLIFAGMRLIVPRGYASSPYGYQAPSNSPYNPQAPSYGSTPMPMPTPGVTETPGSGNAPTVSLKNLAFNPKNLTVRVGTQVVWTNDETSAIPHTVTSGTPNAPSGMFDSGNLNPGQSFQFTFNTPGTFAYFCRIHGAAMTGTITVTP